MFNTMSKFFEDPKNKAYTSADNIWWYVHNFTKTIFYDAKGNLRMSLSRVLKGPFEDEIKPLVKYVMTGGTPTELFSTKGSGYTPVMTVTGLQKFLMRLPNNTEAAKLRDIADQTLALWILKNAPSGQIKELYRKDIEQQLYRKDIEQQRAAGGTCIAPPPEPVLAVSACVFLL
jgi:hypothetical protein